LLVPSKPGKASLFFFKSIDTPLLCWLYDVGVRKLHLHMGHVLRAEESTVGTDAINGAGCLEVGRNSLEG
jgi:hypothetical protein